MPSTYPPGATKQCPQCGVTLRLGSFGGHMRGQHGTYGGVSGIVRDDPRYRDRPRRIPNTHASKNVPAGSYPNGSVEQVPVESMEAVEPTVEPTEVWEGPTDGREPCPQCGALYRVPYLYSHMRSAHGIYGGATGTKRRQYLPPPPKRYFCDDCDGSFDTAQGLGMHRTRKHRPEPESSKALVPMNGAQHASAQAPSFRQLEGFIVQEDEQGNIFLAFQLLTAAELAEKMG